MDNCYCGAPAKWRVTRTGMGNVKNVRACSDHLDSMCDDLQLNRGLDEVTDISVASQTRLTEVAELELLLGSVEWQFK